MKTKEIKCSDGLAAKSLWTDFDEATLLDLLKRRKSAGFRKPSRDVGKQLLQLGDITPSPNTVASAIVRWSH